MPKPLLHTKLRQTIMLNLNTDEVAFALSKMGARISDDNPDTMLFEYAATDIFVKGVIERWQGTEARLSFEGEVSLPPFNQTLRNWILAFAAIGLLAAAIFVFLPMSIAFWGTDGIFIFFATHLALALAVAILFLLLIIYLLNIDPLTQRRWDAQQALAAFGERLENLEISTQSEPDEANFSEDLAQKQKIK